MRPFKLLACWFALSVLVSSAPIAVCQDALSKPAAQNDVERDAPSFPCKLSSKSLPNLVQVHAKVISGGLPNGEAAFRELSQLGVRTIICVDGARPDFESARMFGIRTVHLPHGYNGISDAHSKLLAKAVRELDGPIYIHCHHGKHRSPTASAIACVSAGLIPPSQAIEVLRLAGTSEKYVGLYAAAKYARAFDVAELEAQQAEFPEMADVPPIAAAMVELTHVHERLQQIADAGWRTPEDHPDLQPAHEALLLREAFTELLRHADPLKREESFRRWLVESEAAARELEERLAKHIGNADSDPRNLAALNTAWKFIAEACQVCHTQFRDVPLPEQPLPQVGSGS